MKLEIYFKLLGNLFIIFMIYILPLVFFLKAIFIERNSKLIKTLVTISYIVLYFLLPELYTNILPFILIIFIIISWMNSKNRNEDYITYEFSLSNFKMSKGIKYVCINYVLVFVCSTIWYSILASFNISIEEQEVVNLLSSYDLVSFITTIPFTVVFAPVVEEFVFRYLLYGELLRKRLRGKLGFIISAVITSILFASLHFSFSAFATIFAISFFNCYLIERKGFWYPVFVHLIFNGVSTSALLLQKIILY